MLSLVTIVRDGFKTKMGEIFKASKYESNLHINQAMSSLNDGYDGLDAAKAAGTQARIVSRCGSMHEQRTKRSRKRKRTSKKKRAQFRV